MSEENYQPSGKDRDTDDFDRDLHPDGLGGRNVGMEGSHPEKGSPKTAHDLKNLNRQLNDLDNSDLKNIPVMPEGSRLEQGATYIDLRGDCTEFTAMGNESAGPKNAYVPKSEVDYQLWNHLIGVQNPDRLNENDEGATGNQ